MTRQSPISSRASIAASAKPTIPSALKANAAVESFIDNAEGVRESTPKTFVDQRRRRSSINAEDVRRSTPKAFPINAEGVPDQRRRRSRSTPKTFVDQRRRRSRSTPKAFPINAEGVREFQPRVASTLGNVNKVRRQR